MNTEKMHTRKSDELLLIQFVMDQGWDETDLVEAATRLRVCIEDNLNDYTVKEGETL